MKNIKRLSNKRKYVIMIIGDGMRYLVRVGELGGKIDYLENQLSIINENINNLTKVKSSVIWEGEASLKFFTMLDNYINELKLIAQNTLELINYLNKYYDRYSTRYGALHRKYIKVDNEVKLNGVN